MNTVKSDIMNTVKKQWIENYQKWCNKHFCKVMQWFIWKSDRMSIVKNEWMSTV
jgi:hypothetical protein